PQAGGEVQLPAHRPLGHRGDLLPGAGVLGEQLDDLGRDERGVDVHDEQADAVAGERAARHPDVHAERRGGPAQLGGQGGVDVGGGPRAGGAGERHPGPARPGGVDGSLDVGDRDEQPAGMLDQRRRDGTGGDKTDADHPAGLRPACAASSLRLTGGRAEGGPTIEKGGPGWERRGTGTDPEGYRRTVAPLGTTVMPDSVTVKPRSRSCSRSTPTCAPSAIRTFLSMIARWTPALRPTSTLSKITESRTEDQELTFVPGEITDPMTSPPETMTPGETSESSA